MDITQASNYIEFWIILVCSAFIIIWLIFASFLKKDRTDIQIYIACQYCKKYLESNSNSKFSLLKSGEIIIYIPINPNCKNCSKEKNNA